MKVYLSLVLSFLFITATVAFADFYTWEDENGTVHITDYPPPQIKTAPGVKVYKQEGPEELEKAPLVEEKKPEIILYTKNDCEECDKAKAFLRSRNLPFTEHNMDLDPAAAAQRKELDDSEEVPFAVINRVQVYGFSETVYNRALKLIP